MFDQVMWVAYLCTGLTCGLLGLGCIQLAAQHSRDTRPTVSVGIALYLSGAVCTWLAAVVGLPEHTSQVLVLTVLVGVIVVATMVASSRLLKGLRHGGTTSEGA